MTSSSAEAAKWDFLAHYQKRCEQIEKAIAALSPETTRTIVLLGDSITEGDPLKQLAGMTVVNQGISGDRIDIPTSSAGVRARLKLVAKAKPAHVFLLIGINDFWGGAESVEQARQEYEGLMKDLVAALPDAKIHVQSIFPTGGNNAYMLPKVVEMNKHIERIAKQYNLDYIDLFSLMVNPQGQMRQEFTSDGVHLTPAGYQCWTNKLEEVLAKTK